MRYLIRHFLRGLLVVVPLAATLWIVATVFNWMDSLMRNIFGKQLTVTIPGTDLQWSYGLGALMTVVIITVLGFPHLQRFGQVVYAPGRQTHHPPARGQKLIYSSIKDMVEAFVSEKKKFDKPVLLAFAAHPEVEVIGFVTRQTLAEFGRGRKSRRVRAPVLQLRRQLDPGPQGSRHSHRPPRRGCHGLRRIRRRLRSNTGRRRGKQNRKEPTMTRNFSALLILVLVFASLAFWLWRQPEKTGPSLAKSNLAVQERGPTDPANIISPDPSDRRRANSETPTESSANAAAENKSPRNKESDEPTKWILWARVVDRDGQPFKGLRLEFVPPRGAQDSIPFHATTDPGRSLCSNPRRVEGPLARVSHP